MIPVLEYKVAGLCSQIRGGQYLKIRLADLYLKWNQSAWINNLPVGPFLK